MVTNNLGEPAVVLLPGLSVDLGNHRGSDTLVLDVFLGA